MSEESGGEEYLNKIDDETFQKIIEEAKEQRFETEEEALVFIEKLSKEKYKKKRAKRDVAMDEREKDDPYYAMMKNDDDI